MGILSFIRSWTTIVLLYPQGSHREHLLHERLGGRLHFYWIRVYYLKSLAAAPGERSSTEKRGASKESMRSTIGRGEGEEERFHKEVGLRTRQPFLHLYFFASTWFIARWAQDWFFSPFTNCSGTLSLQLNKDKGSNFDSLWNHLWLDLRAPHKVNIISRDNGRSGNLN